MLTSNQNKFKSELNSLFKEAYIKAKEKTLPEAIPGKEDADICDYSKKAMEEAIEKEATEFANKIAEKLAQLITDHIKSASINCVITTPLTVTTPMGPGTAMGPINSSDFTIT